MANCLVTKLKESVQNDNLSILGALTMRVNAATSPTDNQRRLQLVVEENETVKITAVGGNFTKDGVSMNNLTIVNADGQVSLYFDNANFKAVIDNKYGIRGISTDPNSILSFDVSELVCPKVSQIALQSQLTKGNINDMNLPALIQTRFTNSTHITGNISAFNTCNSCTSLVLSDCSNISGNIDSVGNLTSLATIAIEGTNVEGTIEGFVAGQVNAGRTSTSNTIICNGFASHCTFGGVIRSGSNRSFLEWNGTSKITLYAGNSTFANCNYIYAKGATAEEIAAWEGTGKTVTVIS